MAGINYFIGEVGLLCILLIFCLSAQCRQVEEKNNMHKCGIFGNSGFRGVEFFPIDGGGDGEHNSVGLVDTSKYLRHMTIFFLVQHHAFSSVELPNFIVTIDSAVQVSWGINEIGKWQSIRS